jgi:hypothetical protein
MFYLTVANARKMAYMKWPKMSVLSNQLSWLHLWLKNAQKKQCLALSDTEPAQSIESLAQVNRQIHSEAIVEISSQLARKFFSVLFLFKKYLSR